MVSTFICLVRHLYILEECKHFYISVKCILPTPFYWGIYILVEYLVKLFIYLDHSFMYIDKYNPLYFSGVFGGLLPDCVRVQVGLQQLSNLHPSPKGKK